MCRLTYCLSSGQRHTLVSTHNFSYDVNRSCSAPEHGIILLPGGSYVLPFWSHLEFCGPNNTLIRRKPQRREPYKITYYRNTSILVESFTRRTKTIKEVNWLGGKDRMFASYTGVESSGVSVYGRNVFIISKFRELNVFSSHAYTDIYRHVGRHHLASMYTVNSEPGSDYGLLRGELVDRLPVLIASSGRTICVIRHSGLSESAYVTVIGDVFIAGPGNNRIYIFDNRCRPYDEYIQLPRRHYVQDIVGLGDVILATILDADPFVRYVSIYVKGRNSSSFDFSWD